MSQEVPRLNVGVPQAADGTGAPAATSNGTEPRAQFHILMYSSVHSCEDISVAPSREDV